MKKLIKAMSAMLCMMAVLAGCNGNASQSDSTISESTPMTTESTPTQTESAPAATESTPSESPEDVPSSVEQTQAAQPSGIAAKLEGPDKEVPDLSGADIVTADGQSISASEMTEDNWLYISTDYVYLAIPQGVSYNSTENADIYNENTYSFSEAPENITYEYKKYKVGDEICGLTVSYARASFLSELFNTYPNYFNGGDAQFEGELTLTGYCSIAPEDDGYTAKNDILFVPDADSCKIPVMNYPHGNKDSRLFKAATGNFSWQNEYGAAITLGNANEYKELDLSAFPEDGTFIKVKVTVNNIHVRDEWNFTKNTGASIVDLEIM